MIEDADASQRDSKRESGRGLPHSTTLVRVIAPHDIPPGGGVRQSSGALSNAGQRRPPNPKVQPSIVERTHPISHLSRVLPAPEFLLHSLHFTPQQFLGRP